MGNKNNKDNQKGILSLPPLLSGSEYKTDDSDLYRSMNLPGFAVAIVLYAKKDGVSDDCKEAWFKSFEKECAKVVQNRKKLRDYHSRKAPSNRSPNTGNEDWHEKWVLAWLKSSLFNTPDWNGLHEQTKVQIVWLKEDSSAEWWKAVQNVCMRLETTVDAFDPIAEIWRITKEYHAENEPVRQNKTGDNDTETDAEKTKPKATRGKWRRLGIGIKKVVEKGWQIFTKSFWEAVLDRVLPK